MKIQIDVSELKKLKWHEYAVRFLFGGGITVVTGLLAKHYGPVFGGLFLAFPAIFPASATLVQNHEKQKKRRAGIPKTNRGRHAAANGARSVAIGSIGLASFACLVWELLPRWNAALVGLIAVSVWLVVSVLIWRLRKLHA